MMNIGIVCEGPTDYIILKEVVDTITGEDNYYVQLQPELDLMGRYGNGWKGVWKWCADNAGLKKQLMKDIEPVLDVLIIQMDGDVSRKNGVVGSSTESHVSHILSDRLSSRPMGWSRTGMSKMVELRVYYYNKGDMLELVRYQKKELPKAVGSEEVICSSSQMWREERKRRKELGQMADMPEYSISYNQIKKIANFKAQIVGL